MCAPEPGHELDGTWEILPHRVIGPCTYQYDPPSKPWGGFAAVEIHEAAYPFFERDEKKRILRVTPCPDGGPPGGTDDDVDIVFNYDTPESAQPEFYAPTSDELDRKLAPRKRPR